MTATARHLHWPGCFNVRDLGGLPAKSGVVRRGAFVRADQLSDLTPAGWDALWAHGVRTIIDLRNPEEVTEDRSPRPPELTTERVALDGSHDREFWDIWESGPQFGTPLYYWPHLQRFPDRSIAVLGAIAEAAPGGVAFHCAGGRDRSGQIALLLLRLLDVSSVDIAEDYGLSAERLVARYAARGEPDQQPLLAGYLAQQGTTAREVIMDLLVSTDVLAPLRAAGLTDTTLGRLRARGLGTV